MKIVAFTGIPGFQARSTEIVTGHLVERLRERGLTVIEKPLSVPTRWMSLLPRLPVQFVLRYLVYPLYARVCWRHHRGTAVYYVTEHANAMLARALSNGARVLVQVHDLANLLPLRSRTFPASFTDRLVHWLSVAFKRPGIVRADHVLAISEATKQQLIQFLGLAPEEITNISCGVDCETFSPGDRIAARKATDLDLEAQYLMSIAPAKRQKNIACLLRALDRLAPAFPHLKLIHVGQFDRLSQRIIRGCRLADRIRQFVNVSTPELVRLYRAADVYVFPSLYEGFGLPCAEAMACGCCTVISGIPALEEAAAGAASVFRSNDDAHLATQVEAVLRDTQLASDLRLRGLRRAAELTWDAAADRMLPILEMWNDDGADGNLRSAPIAPTTPPAQAKDETVRPSRASPVTAPWIRE